MRFLCLTGHGSNAEVSEAQLAPIRAQMDPAHELVFAPGAIECAPPPGVPSFYRGPFFCYYTVPTPDGVRAAHELVHEFMEEHGPFQGILGFSQGAALAASILLHHRKTQPHEPDLFDVAVFISASLPFDPDSDVQRPPRRIWTEPETGRLDLVDWDAPNFGPSQAAEVVGYLLPDDPNTPLLQRYHPGIEETRIAIPTVHVQGAGDYFLPQLQAVADLCEKETRFVVLHEQGHNIPRDLEFSKSAAATIESAIAKAIYRR